jgi:hypothetical protein
VAVVAAVAAISAITVAQAAPSLPARTPAELLAAVAGDHTAPPPLTGTVVETASLGVPQLPGQYDATSIQSLAAGSHTLKVWYGGPARLRLAVPVQLGESDFILNGTTAWLWQSNNDSVTKFVLPARQKGEQAAKRMASRMPLTPQQAAKQALAAVGPTTRVTTESNVTIAGEPAYQLVIAPRSSGSLIGKITIALDAQHLSVPLRVQIFARGATSPAYQVGYQSISFVQPAAANFNFTPPPGSHVHTAFTPGAGLPTSGAPIPQQTGQFQVIGKDWLSVAVLPASDLSAMAGQGNAASVAGQAARSAAGGGGTLSGGEVFGALLGAAHPVHGAWGSGRLLHTALLSMLITNGHVLMGAVTPSVLYADAAQVK